MDHDFPDSSPVANAARCCLRSPFFLGTRVQRTVPVAAAARMAGRSQMVARLWQDGSRSIAWVIDGEFMVIFS